MAGFEELSLICIVPRGGGECREFEITADPSDTGEKLKKKLEKVCGIPADDLELFCKNQDKEDEKQRWIVEDQTLASQEVRDGAVFTIGVHGMKGADTFDPDPETGEMPGDAVTQSVATKGDASYYHAHVRQKDRLPEEHRVVSGGAPAKLGDSENPIPEPRSMKQQLDGEDDPNLRAEKPIHAYSWGDEKEFIKIYIEKDNEEAAIAAAGDGKQGQVEVKWKERYLKLKVHAEKHDLVLELDRIYYDIVPEECKFRVSQDKRISLSLKKKEKFTWLKLLKPES